MCLTFELEWLGSSIAFEDLVGFVVFQTPLKHTLGIHTVFNLKA